MLNIIEATRTTDELFISLRAKTKLNGIEMYEIDDLKISDPAYQFCAGIALSLGILDYPDIPINYKMVFEASKTPGLAFVLHQILKTDRAREQEQETPILSLQRARDEFEIDQARINGGIRDDWSPALKTDKFNREKFIDNSLDNLQSTAFRFFMVARTLFMVQSLSIIQMAQSQQPYRLNTFRSYIKATNNFV